MLLSKAVDDLAEGEKGLVDVVTFAEVGFLDLSFGDAFWPSQINEIYLWCGDSFAPSLSIFLDNF